MDFLNLVILVDESGGLSIPVVDKLIPNLWAFLAQFIAFVIMAIIVVKFAYKPVHNFIAKRQEYVQSNLEKIKKDRLEAEAANKKAQDNLSMSHKEAVEILNQAKLQAEKDKSQAEAELQKELQQKRIQAEKVIEQEKRKAVEDAKDEIVDIALQASSSLIGRNISSEDNKRLVEEMIEDVSGDNNGND